MDDETEPAEIELPKDYRDPTPSEIRKRCSAIRRSWSQKERWKRSGRSPSVMTIRMVKRPRRTK